MLSRKISSALAMVRRHREMALPLQTNQVAALECILEDIQAQARQMEARGAPVDEPPAATPQMERMAS